jgi:twinkle protein
VRTRGFACCRESVTGDAFFSPFYVFFSFVAGKTTFLGQVSLDMAEQGINVLWGSFEIRNTRLMHKLLNQFAREPLPSGDPSLADKLSAIADRFSMLPMHFLKFHGGSDVDDILEAMDYGVYVYDCQHIGTSYRSAMTMKVGNVATLFLLTLLYFFLRFFFSLVLDNLQFMISRESSGSGKFDKFDAQDIAIEKFRKFATDRNVHVTLVVHPRKEDDSSRLSISSIYGSAKATQEADTVIILQNENSKKYLDVRKNRFNGDLGQTPLFFDRNSCRYSEIPPINTKPKMATPKITTTTSPPAERKSERKDRYDTE